MDELPHRYIDTAVWLSPCLTRCLSVLVVVLVKCRRVLQSAEHRERNIMCPFGSLTTYSAHRYARLNVCVCVDSFHLASAFCCLLILTLHIQYDALGHRRGHSVGGNAQIGAHLIAAHFGQRQHIAIVDKHCKCVFVCVSVVCRKEVSAPWN